MTVLLWVLVGLGLVQAWTQCSRLLHKVDAPTKFVHILVGLWAALLLWGGV